MMEERAFEYIDAIAEQLGVAAEHVYDALLKQAMVSGMISVFQIVIGIAVIIGFYKLVKSIFYGKSAEDSPYYDEYGLSGLSASLLLIGGILTIIFAINLVISLSNAATAFLNPEYWAIKEILSAVRGGE